MKPRKPEPHHELGEAFVLLAKLAAKDGAIKNGGCWERTFGPWWVAVNGHSGAVPNPHSPDREIQPQHAVVEYNGWVAGFLHPHGGVITLGKVNEKTFIAALQAELAK